MSLLPSRKKEITEEEAAQVLLARRAARESFVDFCRYNIKEFSPRSAAAKPSAIFFWRSSIAFRIGGQIYFIVTHIKTRYV